MEIKLLRKLFQEGLLLTARVLPAPMETDRWILVFDKASGAQEQITKARDNETKIYKRINGALIDAQEIGFKRVSVEFTAALVRPREYANKYPVKPSTMA